jgi:hypothetical protein
MERVWIDPGKKGAISIACWLPHALLSSKLKIEMKVIAHEGHHSIFQNRLSDRISVHAHQAPIQTAAGHLPSNDSYWVENLRNPCIFTNRFLPSQLCQHSQIPEGTEAPGNSACRFRDRIER